MIEDKRKTGLKNGLRQLTNLQLRRVIGYPGEMVLDGINYDDGKFCPLAIGIGMDDWDVSNWTHAKVHAVLTTLGFDVANTRGIEGEFYTTNRRDDLIEAAVEVLQERAG